MKDIDLSDLRPGDPLRFSNGKLEKVATSLPFDFIVSPIAPDELLAITDNCNVPDGYTVVKLKLL